MIIWINGTFGSGKSTTAYELQRRIKDSHVYDPERFGYVLMRNVPREIAKGDFQDYPLWREANYKLLKQVAEQYPGILIVPMTLTNEVYFNQIIGRLRLDGIEIKHFTLYASKETIEKRLKKRLEGKNSWAYKQMEGRLVNLSKDTFQEHIHTDSMSIDEVVETIAHKSKITLLPDRRTKIKKTMDRLSTGIKEFGIFK
ncbi:AAA family ATPase [Bacillus sp. FJAT-49732]|uniref:AAA family ATPase n=1 Tax=Lederbergia citrisecunda TaxID=2833583 RepID=A0A942YQE7_9BACI|nr:AAA family ATPase [Lederbergia citrisecunda]MBS4202206.1 AAA family ATPase [Lederbergia citrisecunda]